MNAQELVKLCDAAEDDRDCYAEHIIIRQGCSSCEAYLAREPAKARRKLELAGFSLLARARQYAVLEQQVDWALGVIEKAQKVCHDDWCSDDDHAPFCDYLTEALAKARVVLATEVKLWRSRKHERSYAE